MALWARRLTRPARVSCVRPPTATTSSRLIRVLAWPGLSTRQTNGYTWALYQGMDARGEVAVSEFSIWRVLRGRFDILHMHWPEYVLARRSIVAAGARATVLVLLLGYLRLLRKKVVWTAHNLKQHEHRHPRLEKAFWWALQSSLHGVFCLSRGGLMLLRETHPRLRRVPAFITPHGHYRDLYGEPADRATSRRRLGIPADAQVVAYVGNIRPYKNVDHLIAVFRHIGRRDARLIVAGRPMGSAEERELLAAAAGDDRIVLMLRFLADDDLKAVVATADVIALPFKAILNSGSTLLALSLNRPVLVPRLGALRELEETVGSAWVRMYDGLLSAGTVEDALSWAVRRSSSDVPNLSMYDWDDIAQRTVVAYRAILAKRSADQPSVSQARAANCAGPELIQGTAAGDGEVIRPIERSS